MDSGFPSLDLDLAINDFLQNFLDLVYYVYIFMGPIWSDYIVTLDLTLCHDVIFDLTLRHDVNLNLTLRSSETENSNEDHWTINSPKSINLRKK